LKQSPRAWNRCLDDYLCENGILPLDAGPCVYTKKVGNTVALTIGVFVDDIVIAGKDTLEIAKFKKTMISHFKMTEIRN
jgi:hypothetical protein